MQAGKAILIIYLYLFPGSTNSVFAQNTLVGGKWSNCTTMNFDENYNCKNSVVQFEFFSDGTYKQLTEHIVNSKKYPYFTGRWSLNGASLITDIDDYQTVKFPGNEFEIVWLNENTFYYQGTEGPNGPVVYTYYQRITE